MKKGQSEILGLTVIVLILLIALVLFVTLTRDKDIGKEQVRSNIKANNLLNAILMMSMDDKESFSKHISKCVLDGNCNNEKNILKEIFSKFFSNDDSYNFKVSSNCYSFDLGNCKEGIAASPQLISYSDCEIEINLMLC